MEVCDLEQQRWLEMDQKLKSVPRKFDLIQFIYLFTLIKILLHVAVHICGELQVFFYK